MHSVLNSEWCPGCYSHLNCHFYHSWRALCVSSHLVVEKQHKTTTPQANVTIERFILVTVYRNECNGKVRLWKLFGRTFSRQYHSVPIAFIAKPKWESSHPLFEVSTVQRLLWQKTKITGLETVSSSLCMCDWINTGAVLVTGRDTHVAVCEVLCNMCSCFLMNSPDLMWKPAAFHEEHATWEPLPIKSSIGAGKGWNVCFSALERCVRCCKRTAEISC